MANANLEARVVVNVDEAALGEMEQRLKDTFTRIKREADRVPSLEKQLKETQELLWEQIRRMKVIEGDTEEGTRPHFPPKLLRETKRELVERIVDMRRIVAEQTRNATVYRNTQNRALNEVTKAIAERDAALKTVAERDTALASANSLAESEGNRARTAIRKAGDEARRADKERLNNVRIQQRLEAALYALGSLTLQLRRYQEKDPEFLAQHGIVPSWMTCEDEPLALAD